MARGVASKRIVMVTPFLLLGSLVVAGWGCGPAPAAGETFHAAPYALFPAADVFIAALDPLVPLVDDPLVVLARGLSSPKVAERKRTLKLLVADGSAPAWRQAFPALADPESEVGDAAQLLLAKIADAAVATELAGRVGLAHKDLAPRVRAAEGFGRMTCSVDIGVLLHTLDDRESEVAHLALWSVERLANAHHLGGDLERGVTILEHAGRSHRDANVRAAAICARAAIAAKSAHAEPDTALPDYLHFLQRCGEDRDPRVRCAVALAARDLPPDMSLSLTRPFGMDPKLSVRLARIESLEGLACKSSMLCLIDAFDTETALRARAEIVAALQRLSGLKHRDDPRPWRDWMKGLPADWRPVLIPPRTDSDSAPAAVAEEQTSARVNFVGLPLVSPRICFAIDFSGSMWTPMSDGRVPKELVDARLRATLEALTPATEFNIVPFTNDVLPWRPKLVPANPANVHTAIADFEKCQARGRGNFFDAAIFALDDPEVETLLTLTDGIPTGGFHSDLDLVVPLLLERNRFRRVAFDTVLVDSPLHAQRRWRILAQFSGGRLITTDRAE